MSDVFKSAEYARDRMTPPASDSETVKRLLSTTNAAVWADEFVKAAHKLGHVGIDEAWAIGWFANAIETGRAAGRAALLAFLSSEECVEALRIPAGLIGHDEHTLDARVALSIAALKQIVERETV